MEDLNKIESAFFNSKFTYRKSSIVKINKGSCDPATCCCGCSCLAFVTTITGILGALAGLAYAIYAIVKATQN
jgi:hypothetical protein